MAAQHGGHRTPSHPASVSGPGSLSKRTDGKPKVMDPGGMSYGENSDFHVIQTGAQMGAGAPTPAPGPVTVDPSGLTPLSHPSARPEEPVTAGSPLGPGIGPLAAGIGPGAVDAEDLDRLSRYLPALIERANRPDSTASFRNYVRVLKAKLVGA